MYVLRDAGDPSSIYNRHLWLWVPACAGTTFFPDRLNDEAVASHPGLSDIGRLAVLLWQLPLLLPGAVAAVEAAGGRAQQAMMAGHVTGDAANRRTLQAALGLGG